MRTTAVAALLAACSSTSDVTLTLTDDNNDCATIFVDVRAISIEVIATNGACRLAHECAASQDDFGSIADMEQALSNTADVLLELDNSEDLTLVINGRPQRSCFPSTTDPNEPVLCGYAPIGSAKNGALVVELGPDTDNACPESITLCP